jgi:GH24 family phage-related lysozyme (muramidase)
MTVQGVQLKPYVSLAAVITVGTGALVYHFRIRSSVRPEPVIETY